MNYTDIVTMIMRNDDLQTVLDSMSEYIQAALIIFSEDMEILAFSKSISPRDPFLSQACKQGGFSNEVIKKIIQDPFLKNFTDPSGFTCGTTYLIDNVTLKYYITLPKDTYRYAISFTANPLDDRFDKRQQELLLSFALLIKNSYFHSRTLPFSYSYRGQKEILQKLLDRKYANSHEINNIDVSASDETMFENIQILVFSPEYQKSTDVLLHYYADSIYSITNNDFATAYSGSVVTIFNHQQVSDSYINQLMQLAEQANAKIGISWTFSGKENIRAHYKQALFCIEKARELSLTDRIFSYDDMFIYSLLDHCHKKEPRTEFTHPVLSLLKQYDEEHDASLYDTLYCFLKCGLNSSLTAKKLEIHKSTLYHRMEVIKELIPDFPDKPVLWYTSVMLAFDMTKI